MRIPTKEWFGKLVELPMVAPPLGFYFLVTTHIS
jgi:hypothetical protein